MVKNTRELRESGKNLLARNEAILFALVYAYNLGRGEAVVFGLSRGNYSYMLETGAVNVLLTWWESENNAKTSRKNPDEIENALKRYNIAYKRIDLGVNYRDIKKEVECNGTRSYQLEKIVCKAFGFTAFAGDAQKYSAQYDSITGEERFDCKHYIKPDGWRHRRDMQGNYIFNANGKHVNDYIEVKCLAGRQVKVDK